MKIGIIGLGVVGNANKIGFELLNHEVVVHDLKHNTKFDKLLQTEMIFICLPTDPKNREECFTTHIEEYVELLNKKSYVGIIVIRSTVYPGFTQKMIDLYSNLKICNSPEFLKERASVEDFMNQNLLVVGTNDKWIYNKVVEVHGTYPKQIDQLLPVETEILKYYANTFAGLRVVFANIFYEICNKFDANYTEIKKSYIKTKNTTDFYLDVNKNLRGYAGTCLPKDINFISSFLKKLDLDYTLLDSIVKDNDKFEATSPKGMRKSK
jgi:nucleotide sugar dehydrogenase